MIRKIPNILLTVLLLAGLIIPAFLSTPVSVNAASNMVQTIIGGGYQWVAGAATNYFPLMGISAYATETATWQKISVSGTFSNFYVRTSSAPTSHVYTLRISGASTAMVVTLTGTTSGSYTASTIAVASNSFVNLMVVSTDAAATPYIYWTVDFTPTGSTTTSIISGGTTTALGATRFTGIYGTNLTADATETNRSQVMPTAGTFSNLIVWLSARPGAATDAYSFTLMKNGIATALTCTIVDPNQDGSDVANSVSVVAGDLVSLQIVPINVPAASPTCSFGVKFTATVPYESVVMAMNTDTLNPAATEYNYVSVPAVSAGVPTNWTATEANVRQIAGNFTAKKLYISLSGSPDNGAGTQSYTLALRNTGTTTVLTTTISELAATGNDITDTVSYSRGEFMTMICVPVGTPTARFARWSFVEYYNPDAVVSASWNECLQKDYFTTGGDAGGTNIYGATYGAQSFTTLYAYTVCFVKVSLQRSGTPGTLTLAVKATNSAGDPTGDDLASGTFNGDTLGTAAYTWTTFTLLTSAGDQLSLQKGYKYVLVLKAVNGSAANYVQWYADTAAGYAGGNANISTDGGSTWNQFAMAGYDYLFEFWGKNSLVVISAKVFQDYKQAGDWIVVCHYYNKSAPHYPNGDVTNYFYLQFRDSTTVLAQIPCQQWGERPGSIYLSALKVIPLEWLNVDYNINLVSSTDSATYSTYTLLAADWRGKDLDELDAYCLGIANSIEGNAVTGSTEATLTTDLSTKGTVLNDNGATLFNKGVNGLSIVRPNLFLTTTSSTSSNTGKGISYKPVWQDKVGTYVTGVFNQVGDVAGVDGRTFGMILILIVYVAIAVGAFGAGHSSIAMAIAIPFVLMGLWLGLIEVAVFCILGAVVIYLLMRQLHTGR